MALSKLLFIPHFPINRRYPFIRTRGEELAKRLTKYFEVYYLGWHVGRDDCMVCSIASRLRALLNLPKRARYQGMTLVDTPKAPYWEWTKPGLFFDRAMLNKVISSNRIELAINESTLFDMSKTPVPYVYDFVDDHLTQESRSFWSFISEQVKGSIGVTVCSKVLKEKISNVFGIKPLYIPNGVDVQIFRSADGKEIRKSLNLNGKFVIGFVGNHIAPWTGLRFLLDVFKGLKVTVKGAALLIVGGGSEVKVARDRVKKEGIPDVILTGPIKHCKVNQYISAIDIGVLPFEKNVWTNAAFPMKVLEYTASRKLVLSTPLDPLKAAGLSNIMFVNRNVEEWASVIASLRDLTWNETWDMEVEMYSWDRLAKIMASFLSESALTM